MSLTYIRQSKFEKLRNRRLPLEKQAQWFTEEYRRATKQTDYEYLVESMQPIDNVYTEQTFEQGDRVKNQLTTNLDRVYAADYAYQGSVTSDTHIKVHSDIDLITLNGMFVTIETGAPNPSPWFGDVVKELRSLRRACADILTRKFPQVDVDTTGAKAIALSGGSLEREIDVVIANWWDTPEYLRTSSKIYRAVHVLDNDLGTRIKNMPFLHNSRIHEKDLTTNSGLRKAIRLLKTLKYDAEPVLGISSYDVAAIAYAMPESSLTVNPGQYLQLAIHVNEFLKGCINSSTLRDSLYVPNGTRLIFGANGASLASLTQLQGELDGLLASITLEKSASMVLLNELQNRNGFGQNIAPWTETRSRRVAALL